MTRLRILVLSPDVPFPPIGGGNLRSYHLLRLLAARYEVTLVAFTYGGSQADAPPFPLRVLEVPWELPPLYRDLYSDGAIRAEAASRQLAELTEPSFVSISESPAMEEALDRLHRSERFDLALIEHTVMARFLHVLPPGLPKVLDLHNVHSLMASRVAAAASEDEHESARWEADRTLRFERQVASHCALCLTVSEVEAAAARSLLGIETTQVIPNGVDTAYFTPAKRYSTVRGNLLFTGSMSYDPNIEASTLFISRILPIILQREPDSIFHIVGDKPSKEVNNMASNSVRIYGRVPDVRPYYKDAEVVVVPLVSGGGTRLKILEAAASGKAIVTTSVGMEGLFFHDGDDLVVADTPEAFAWAVSDLIGDVDRQRELGARARQTSLAYDWNSIGVRLYESVESLMGGPPRWRY